MADVKWIKIVTNIFDDEKILLIESLPEADSIIVIWFKLLTLAGKQNNSGVFMLNDRMPYTDEMFATIFRRKKATVQMALKTFEEFGMIEVVNDAVTIPNWSRHQTLDQIESRNEYMKNYMRKYREKQKELASGNKVAQGGLPLSEWKDTIDYFDNECAYCGKKNTELEQDHIVPVSTSGRYSKDNIVPACRHCNSSKSNKDMEEWYRKQKFFSEDRLEKIKSIKTCKVNVNSLRKANVSETELDKNKNKNKNKNKSIVGAQFDYVISEWNSLDENISNIQTINSGTTRYKLLKARENEYGKDKIVEAIKNINNSSFLKGYEKSWKITFDWFIKPNNFIKVLEGNYNDSKNNKPNNLYSKDDRTDEAERQAFIERKLQQKIPVNYKNRR